MKIKSLIESFEPAIDDFEFKDDESALLILGADLEDECGFIHGKVKCLAAMVASCMCDHELFAKVILTAVGLYSKETEDDNDDAE